MEPKEHSKERSTDNASQEMLDLMAKAGQQNAWDRLEAQSPQCGFGKQGICCRICKMGPCRITKKAPLGICGADADTIAARNLLRMIASGAAAHSDHGRDVAHTFKMAVESENCDYEIKDELKLREVAARYGIKVEGRDTKEIGSDLAHAVLAEFGKSEGHAYKRISLPAACSAEGLG